MPLNTTQLQQALANPSLASLSDAQPAQPGWGAPVITPKSFYVNARTLYAIDPAAAKSILGAVQQSDPNLYAILMDVGPNDGSAGGVDISLPASQAFIAGLVAANVVSQADANAILALGQTSTYTFGAAVQTSDVTAARAALALASGKATLLAWLAAQYQAAIAACDAGQVAGTLPTKPQLQALFV